MRMKYPDENVQDGHADINEKDAMSVDATEEMTSESDETGKMEPESDETGKVESESDETGEMASESDETGKVESESDIAEKMTSESDETGKEESESDVSEEMESEPDTEKESEETLPDFYEYWQDGPMRRLGMSGMRRAGNPTVKRDESLILHYLDFPCYFKYVTNHGMSTGGKTVAAYCVYNTERGSGESRHTSRQATALFLRRLHTACTMAAGIAAVRHTIPGILPVTGRRITTSHRLRCISSTVSRAGRPRSRRS